MACANVWFVLIKTVRSRLIWMKTGHWWYCLFHLSCDQWGLQNNNSMMLQILFQKTFTGIKPILNIAFSMPFNVFCILLRIYFVCIKKDEENYDRVYEHHYNWIIFTSIFKRYLSNPCYSSIYICNGHFYHKPYLLWVKSTYWFFMHN